MILGVLVTLTYVDHAGTRAPRGVELFQADFSCHGSSFAPPGEGAALGRRGAAGEEKGSLWLVVAGAARD